MSASFLPWMRAPSSTSTAVAGRQRLVVGLGSIDEIRRDLQGADKGRLLRGEGLDLDLELSFLALQSGELANGAASVLGGPVDEDVEVLGALMSVTAPEVEVVVVGGEGGKVPDALVGLMTLPLEIVIVLVFKVDPVVVQLRGTEKSSAWSEGAGEETCWHC